MMHFRVTKHLGENPLGLKEGDLLYPQSYELNTKNKWYIELTPEQARPNFYQIMANYDALEKVYPGPGYFQMPSSEALSSCATTINRLLTEAQDIHHGDDPQHLQDRQVEILQCLQVFGYLLAAREKASPLTDYL